MDTASETIHALLPVFLVSTLGATPAMLGVIEGVAEAVAAATKPLAGYLSDRWRSRKALTVLGYGLAAASKPLFALAGSAGWVMAARAADRFGKGIRGAPRDALIADITAPEMRGAAYGLRQALDTVGAFAGPLAATIMLGVFALEIRTIFWLATVPAVLAVVVLVLGVREPDKAPRASEHAPLPSRWPAAFWRVCLLGGLMTLARFSEAFLVLRAQGVGLALAWIPMVLVVMNAVYALGAYPAGALSDRIAPARLLTLGALVLVASHLVLLRAADPLMALVGVGLWGLHMALTQGVLAALVAGAAPETARGGAFGLFNLILAAATLVSSSLAGVLWQAGGAGFTFAAGAVFAVLTAAAAHGLGRPPQPKVSEYS